MFSNHTNSLLNLASIRNPIDDKEPERLGILINEAVDELIEAYYEK